MLFPYMVPIKTIITATRIDIQKEKMSSIEQHVFSREATAQAGAPSQVVAMQIFSKSFLFPRDLYYFNKNIDVYCMKLLFLIEIVGVVNELRGGSRNLSK